MGCLLTSAQIHRARVPRTQGWGWARPLPKGLTFGAKGFASSHLASWSQSHSQPQGPEARGVWTPAAWVPPQLLSLCITTVACCIDTEASGPGHKLPRGGLWLCTPETSHTFVLLVSASGKPTGVFPGPAHTTPPTSHTLTQPFFSLVLGTEPRFFTLSCTPSPFVIFYFETRSH